MTRVFWLLPILIVAVCSCGDRAAKTTAGVERAKEKKMVIALTSSAFGNEETIPAKYTCDGSNASPPLSWSGVPTATKSVALIADDPDAPAGTWVHWVIYDIPRSQTQLPEGVPPEKTLRGGAKQGINSSGTIGYTGPCPPSGTHRYYFRLYALDTTLELDPGIRKPQLLEAMRGHVLAEGVLMGRYSKQK